MRNVPPATNNANHPILREKVEAAVKSPEKVLTLGTDKLLSLFDLREREGINVASIE